MSADTCGKKAVPPLAAGIPAGISNKHTIRKRFRAGGNDFLISFFSTISNRIAAMNREARYRGKNSN
jgi:hypothetical protein